MNRWQRLARQRQEERLITPYDPLCICGAASSEHEPASGDPFDGTPHVCKRTGCAGFKRSVNGSSGYPFNRNGKGKP